MRPTSLSRSEIMGRANAVITEELFIISEHAKKEGNAHEYERTQDFFHGQGYETWRK
jgi:hypothetical protein